MIATSRRPPPKRPAHAVLTTDVTSREIWKENRMCPICMTTIAATVAGVSSAGTAVAFVATRLRSNLRERQAQKTDSSVRGWRINDLDKGTLLRKWRRTLVR